MFQAGSVCYLMQPGFPLVRDDSAVLLRPAGSSTIRREKERGTLSGSRPLFLTFSQIHLFIHFIQPCSKKKIKIQTTYHFALICGFIQLERNDSEMTVSLFHSLCLSQR